MLTVPRQIDVEQAKQIYQQGAKNFAEWIDNNINIGIYDYFGNRISAIELLGEWKNAEMKTSLE